MRFSTVAAPLALAGLAAAAPTEKKGLTSRANSGGAYDDATILNYALTLEHLERAFYRDTLNTYGADAFSKAGFSDYVRKRFTEIASQEATHVEFLTTALSAAGATPVKECKYAFGIDSVKTFIATSELLEGVGVAAYLGAAPSISNKAYLAVAGSILVVEAEHETYVRSAVDTDDAFPRPFYAPLDFNQVYSLAAPLITGCPSDNPTLPFKPFPSVTIQTESFYAPGCVLKISTKATGAKYAAFVSATSTKFVPFSGTSGTITIPEDITGSAYLILTKDNKSTTDENTVAIASPIYVPVEAKNFDYNN